MYDVSHLDLYDFPYLYCSHKSANTMGKYALYYGKLMTGKYTYTMQGLEQVFFFSSFRLLSFLKSTPTGPSQSFKDFEY